MTARPYEFAPAMQITPLHSPDEMRQISNLAHVIEGVVLALVAVTALAEATGRLGRGRYLWPILVVVAGAGLLLYLVIPHHGLHRATLQWSFVFGDAQQRQHGVISALILIAGVVEILGRADRLRGTAWTLAWPAALAIVGVMFLVHQQHGTSEAIARATLVHRYLGTSLVLAGVLAGTHALRARRSGALGVAWPLALLVAAVLLIIYREPEGAYHGSMSNTDASGFHDTTAP